MEEQKLIEILELIAKHQIRSSQNQLEVSKSLLELIELQRKKIDTLIEIGPIRWAFCRIINRFKGRGARTNKPALGS